MPPKKGAGRGRSLGRQAFRALNTQDADAAADQYIQDRAAQAAQEAAAQAAMPPPAVPSMTTAPVQVAPVVPAPTIAMPQGGSPTIMVGVRTAIAVIAPRKNLTYLVLDTNWYDKKVKKGCAGFIVR